MEKMMQPVFRQVAQATLSRTSVNGVVNSLGHNVVGLKNTGNTCFLNAVVQSLASVQCFGTYVDQLNAYPPANKDSLTGAFKETFQKMSEGSSSSIIPPIAFVPSLKKRFLTSEQQDAHEFMQYVIQELSDEAESFPTSTPLLSGLLPITKDPRPPFIFRNQISSLSPTSLSSSSIYNTSNPIPIGVNTTKSTNPVNSNSLFKFAPLYNSAHIGTNVHLSQHWSSSSDTSLYSFNTKRNPFAGLLKSTLECTGCKRRSNPSYQKFVDLSLAIPEELLMPNKKTPSLEDCLEFFTQIETIHDVDCISCEKQRSSLARLTIARAPKTLCLHIRRLCGGSNIGTAVKLNCHVEFPLEFDLSPFCSFNEPSPSPPLSSSPNNKTSSVDMESIERFLKSSMKLESSSIVGGSIEHHGRNWKHNHEIPLHVPSSKDANKQKKKAKTLEDDPTTELKYELVSVIVHHGTHAGGHYTVYRKLLDSSQKENISTSVSSSSSKDPATSTSTSSSWYYISDEYSKQVSEDEVLRAQAYMLYYEKQG